MTTQTDSITEESTSHEEAYSDDSSKAQLEEDIIKQLLKHPRRVEGFKPMTREEIYSDDTEERP